MRLSHLLPFLLLPLLGACGSTSALNVYAGQRAFTDGDIQEVDDQTAMGIEWLWGILPWGLGLEIGASYSEEDATGEVDSIDVDLDATTVEGYIGARKTFREEHNLRPYIGAGFSYTQASFEGDGDGVDFDDDDGSEGVYARLGLAYHFTIINFGLDYRISTANEAKFADEDVDLENGLLSIFLGISF